MIITQIIAIFISATLMSYCLTRLSAALLPHILPERRGTIPIGFAPATVLIGFSIVLEMPSGSIFAMLLLMLGFSRNTLIGNHPRTNFMLIAIASLLICYDFYQHHLPAATSPFALWPQAVVLLLMLALCLVILGTASSLSAQCDNAPAASITIAAILCLSPLIVAHSLAWTSFTIGGMILSCILGWLLARNKHPDVTATAEWTLPAVIIAIYHFILITLQVNSLIGLASLSIALGGLAFCITISRKRVS